MTKLRKHQEQFERMKRWYERIKEIDEGRLHNISSDHYHDEVYAFFINCYHLKDWIENDKTVEPRDKGKVEPFMKKDDSMSLCRDICIGIKHLEQQSPPWSGRVPEFAGRKFSLSLGGGPEPIIKVKFSIKTKTGTIDAFKLASECVQKWEEFIKENIE